MIKRLTNILQSNSGEYSLWVEVNPSNLENYFDIRFLVNILKVMIQIKNKPNGKLH